MAFFYFQERLSLFGKANALPAQYLGEKLSYLKRKICGLMLETRAKKGNDRFRRGWDRTVSRNWIPMILLSGR
jgi:hypothetical protein